MRINLIAALAGLSIGIAWAGAAGWYLLLLTRSYRRARNLLVIGMGYLLVGIVSIGSLFLLGYMCDNLPIQGHSYSHYAALYAYAAGCSCTVFFCASAELRWRKAIGLGSKPYPQTTATRD
jgi:hypothetical protein